MSAYDAADLAAQTKAGDDTALAKQEKKFYKEYLDDTGLKQYMGSGNNDVIQVNMKLIDGGDTIATPLVQQLRGSKKGTKTVVGNETKMHASDFLMRPNWVRDGVTIDKAQTQKSYIDLLRARKETLKDSARDIAFYNCLEAFTSVGKKEANYDAKESVPQTNPIATATNTEKSAWQDGNGDRVFFNAANGIKVAGDFDGSITALQAASQPTASQVLNKIKDEAQRRNRITGPTSRYAIRPIRGSGNRKEFLVLVGTKVFNWIENDEEIKEFYKHAARNGIKNNRYFQDGDIKYKGLNIREIPEMDEFNIASDIGTINFCGAQSLALAVGQRLRHTKRDETDYGFISGVGFEELYSYEKPFYGDKNVDEIAPPMKQMNMINCFVKLD
ncbi:MAG: hypothetical protein COB36_14800 [Alphaproteobacteria bacterium]|nr:MAG: hypothetical protein COB36_14800 [Alphaproteobacteria bacterium]